MGYLVLVGVIFAITGSAYVYVQNQHVLKEDRKRAIEDEIAALDEESGQLQRRIAARLVHSEIYKSLRRHRSTLERIPAAAITTIPPADGPTVEVRDASDE